MRRGRSGKGKQDEHENKKDAREWRRNDDGMALVGEVAAENNGETENEQWKGRVMKEVGSEEEAQEKQRQKQ